MTEKAKERFLASTHCVLLEMTDVHSCWV